MQRKRAGHSGLCRGFCALRWGYSVSQIIRCMEGRQNFIAVEKCSPTHTVQLAEEEHRERVGLAGQGAPQHFRAVASLGEYDALPVATILGPPYGGVLRPAGELALMQVGVQGSHWRSREGLFSLPYTTRLLSRRTHGTLYRYIRGRKRKHPAATLNVDGVF